MTQLRDKRLIFMAALVGAVACLAVLPYARLRHAAALDDAYEFFRYAVNLRHGLGISWNPDGIATYGMTSQLWVFLILPFTFLGMDGGLALQLASWLTGIAGLVVMAVTVAHHSRPAAPYGLPWAFAAVTLPLLLNPRFDFHLTTGMDTMLSLLANGMLIWALFHYAASTSLARVIGIGIFACLAMLARPDNFICALFAPLISLAGARSGSRRRDLSAFLAIIFLGIAVDLAVCGWYFGTALPLAFSAYVRNSYRGFTSTENAFEYAMTVLGMLLPYIGIWCVTYRRRADSLQLALVLPAAAATLYLLTVRQHMGFQGRFYVPLIPFVVVPSLLSFWATWQDARGRAGRRAVAGIAVAFVAFAASLPLQHYAARRLLAVTAEGPVDAPPGWLANAPGPLLTDWSTTVAAFGRMAGRLPKVVVIAAVEVGFLGQVSQDKFIIDLVGRNDNEFAKQGFSSERLLNRAPDLIWFPPADYTGLRAALFSDPRLTSRYEVYANAFNNGVAVRRDCALRQTIVDALGAALIDLKSTASQEVAAGSFDGKISQRARHQHKQDDAGETNGQRQ